MGVMGDCSGSGLTRRANVNITQKVWKFVFWRFVWFFFVNAFLEINVRSLGSLFIPLLNGATLVRNTHPWGERQS